jgi:hypothetical protein
MISILIVFHFLLYLTSSKSHSAADMSKFGNCTILVQSFQDDTATEDVTSIVTMAQYSRKRYPIFSIYSSNNTSQVIQPIPSVRVECSLNVIVGFVSESYLTLYKYMIKSRYTFTSHAHSIYIIVMDPNKHPLQLYVHTLTLPTSVFILNIPKTNYNKDTLSSQPVYEYVCFSCKYTLHPLEYNEGIRHINDDWFLHDWEMYNHVIKIGNNVRSLDITMCEQYIWKKWLSPKDTTKSNLSSQCKKPDAFWDLIFRSVNPNLTTRLSSPADGSNYRYSGHFFQNFLGSDWSMTPWKASISHYHASATTSLIYCDCDRRVDMVSYDTWTTCFSQYVWFCLIGAVSFAAVMKSVKSYLTCGKVGLESFMLTLTDMVGISIRQGSFNGVGLAVFSLGMFVISVLFENMLMSTLVVPSVSAIFDLATFAQGNYEILIHSASKVEFNSTRGFLMQELNATNSTVAYNSIQPYNADKWNNSEAFINNRFSVFIIATSTAKDFLKQSLKSITPNHCKCPEVRDLGLKFPVYSLCWHRLRYRIFHNLNLATAAGLDLLYDWNIERIEADFIVLKKEATSGNAISDSFVSFKNLLPLLAVICCFFMLCFLIFLSELRKFIILVVLLKLHRTYQHWQEFCFSKIRFKGIVSL